MNVEAAIAANRRDVGALDRPHPRVAYPDEHQLVAAARSDPQAFALLYRRYVLPLYHYLYHRVGNPQDAEDLTASTFDKALAGLGRYREQGSFPAWLFSIARHTLGDYQRRRRPLVDVASVAALLADPEASPEAELLQAEEAFLLHRLIEHLPADQQEAVMLRYFSGLPIADIAAVLGRSEGAVRALLHRALTALRAAYRQEGAQ